MSGVELRAPAPGEAAVAAALLATAMPWRFPDAGAGVDALARAREFEPDSAIAAVAGGALVGLVLLRRLGEVVEIDALAAGLAGQKIGGLLLDAACERAEEWGAHAVRGLSPAGDPGALALAASRSFAVVDVAVRLIRPPQPTPRLDAARGLDITVARPADLDAMLELERRLTGLERRAALSRGSVLCARRRGNLVGFLVSEGATLGPGVGLDMADLGVLVSRAIVDHVKPARAVLSTAAPTALLAAAGLGFRAEGVELMLVRGPTPPARPAQIY